MPPRSTAPGAQTKGPYIRFSTPIAFGNIAAGSLAYVAGLVGRNFRPDVPTTPIFSATLDPGLVADSYAIITKVNGTPNWTATVGVHNVSAGAINSTVTLLGFYQE